MENVSIGSEGRVRLVDCAVVREWSSLTELVLDYWRYQRLTSRQRAVEDMAAWTCVHDLVGEPAWEGSLELLDALLSAADDDEIGLFAAGPLEELVYPLEQGPMFISGIEARGRRDRRWAEAISGVWLDRGADGDVNRRLARFGARHADGQTPS